LLTDLNVSSLQIKDDKYIQSATNNNEMNLLPSAVISNSVAIIKMNACMKNAFGQGSISLVGATKTVVGAGADYCGSAEPLPVPEVLYDFRESTTTTPTGWINQGSGGGSINGGAISLSRTEAGISAGRAGLASGPITYTNPVNSIGTGDFSVISKIMYKIKIIKKFLF